MAAHFINAADIFNWTVRRVQASNDFIKDGADLPDDTLVVFILSFGCDHFLSRGIENHFAERNAAQFVVLLKRRACRWDLNPGLVVRDAWR